MKIYDKPNEITDTQFALLNSDKSEHTDNERRRRLLDYETEKELYLYDVLQVQVKKDNEIVEKVEWDIAKYDQDFIDL